MTTNKDETTTIKVKAKIKILNWMTGSVIYESEKPTLKEAVVDANLRGVDLRGANLYGADLRDANLRGADLRRVNLYGADLRRADLRDADLRRVNLYDADLRRADLRDADLRGVNLYGADLRRANLRGADLRGADLRGADLYGADLEKLPVDFINQCSRDILFVLEHLKSEVPFLREKLIAGEVDGSQYEGECACLIGTLGNADGGVDKVCEAIPFYEKGTHNMGETFFLNIRKGDTPENNSFAKHAVMLCDMVLGESNVAGAVAGA